MKAARFTQTDSFIMQMQNDDIDDLRAFVARFNGTVASEREQMRYAAAVQIVAEHDAAQRREKAREANKQIGRLMAMAEGVN